MTRGFEGGPTSVSGRRWGWIHPCAWALTLATGVALRLQGRAIHSLWFDEGHTLHGAKAADFVGNLLGDRHPPISFLAFRAWIAAFGEDDARLRLLPALLGCASLALFGRLARAWLEPGAALFAVALFAVSPYSVWIAQEVRMYGFVELGACLGLSGAALVLAGPRRRRHGLALAAAGTALALGSHYTGGLLAVSIGAIAIAALALGKLDRRGALALSGAAALGVAVWLPWLLRIAPEQARTGWSDFARRGPRDLAELPVRHVLIELDALPDRLRGLGLLLGALLLAGFALHAAALARGKPRPAPWPLIAFAAPVACGLAISLVRPVFSPRYTAVAAPATILIAAAGLAALRPAPLRALAAGGALAGCLGLALLHKAGNHREDFRSACAELAARWQAGEWIVPVTGTFPGFSESVVVHYLRERPDMLACVHHEKALLVAPPPSGEAVHVVYRDARYARERRDWLLERARVVAQGPLRFRVQYVLCEMR